MLYQFIKKNDELFPFYVNAWTSLGSSTHPFSPWSNMNAIFPNRNWKSEVVHPEAKMSIP
jgi:hypothetical protein